MSDAIVTVKVKMNERTIVKVQRAISQDMPADMLGEMVAEAIQESWRAGNDPVDTHIVITFK
jgi:hypothetical protein